jgi:hypothetical protein
MHYLDFLNKIVGCLGEAALCYICVFFISRLITKLEVFMERETGDSQCAWYTTGFGYLNSQSD